MQKIFMAIALCLVCAMSFGQLSMQTPQEKGGYRVVYKIKSPFYGANGSIRYVDGVYYLLGVSTNQFEETCHSIYLGNSKSSAIKSIEDLSALKNNMPRDGVYVKSMSGKNTYIYKYSGEIRFETDGVAGFTQVLVVGFKPQKIIDAIEDFKE